MRNKLPRSRDAIVSVVVILITLVQFLISSWSGKIEDAKSLLFDRSITLAIANSALAANSSEITLQRDLIETCKIGGLPVCGSSEILLQYAASIRDATRGSVINSHEEFEKAVKNFRDVSSTYSLPIKLGHWSFYLLVAVALIMTLKIRSSEEV